jgi:hypothetical protein
MISYTKLMDVLNILFMVIDPDSLAKQQESARNSDEIFILIHLGKLPKPRESPERLHWGSKYASHTFTHNISVFFHKMLK